MSKKRNNVKEITPFQKLRNNLDSLFYFGEEKYKKIVKDTFSEVLDQMDIYFSNNNYYNSVNYDAIIDKIITREESLQFLICNDSNNEGLQTLGMHDGVGCKSREIKIPASLTEDPITLKRTLCHEFIHDITLGPKIISYNIGCRSYDVINSTGEITSFNRKHTREINKGFLWHSLPFLNEFLIEGYTEFLTQEIYPGELNSGYESQVKMVEFINKIIGKQSNIEDFLRGYFPIFNNVFTKQDYFLFSHACQIFHTKSERDRSSKDLETSKSFIWVQQIFLSKMFNLIKDNLITLKASELVKYHNSIINYAPADNSFGDIKNKNDKKMCQFVVNYASEIFEDNEERNLFLDKYEEILNDMTQLAKQKFRLENFNDDITFSARGRGVKIHANDICFDLNSALPKFDQKKVVKFPPPNIQIAYKIKNAYIPSLTAIPYENGYLFNYQKEEDKPFFFVVKIDNENNKKCFIEDLENKNGASIDFSSVAQMNVYYEKEIAKKLKELNKIELQARKHIPIKCTAKEEIVQ